MRLFLLFIIIYLFIFVGGVGEVGLIPCPFFANVKKTWANSQANMLQKNLPRVAADFRVDHAL